MADVEIKLDCSSGMAKPKPTQTAVPNVLRAVAKSKDAPYERALFLADVKFEVTPTGLTLKNNPLTGFPACDVDLSEFDKTKTIVRAANGDFTLLEIERDGYKAPVRQLAREIASSGVANRRP